MTDLNPFLSPSPAREAPEGPTLAREAGTPSPENRSWGLLKSFLGKTGLIDPLRARGRGLSTAAHPNNRLESQAKLALGITSDETRFRLFSGGQLSHQLGVNWGSIKLFYRDLGPKPALQWGGDRR